MENKVDYITKTLQIDGIGRVKAMKLFDGLKYDFTCDEDLYDYICEHSSEIGLKVFTKELFLKAIEKAEKIFELNNKYGVKCISCYSSKYPALLLKTPNKPIVLNYLGNIDLLNQMACVAVIGTREPTPKGYNAAHRFGELFAEAQIDVVSGLAKGCDTAGHRGCLNKNGITTAVLAHGLDHVYPKENKELAIKILEKEGVLVSEYFTGTSPMSSFFVERDRIQAGLSHGLVVVETDIKGGSLHTVGFAEKYSRRIGAFAIDDEYNSHDKRRGTEMLLKKGTAKPLGSSKEIELFIELVKNDFQNNIKHKVEKNGGNNGIESQLNMDLK